MSDGERRLTSAWWALRVGLGGGVLLAGLDKFTNVLATWSMYVSPLAERLLPVREELFLRGVGVVEALIGLAVLTRWTRLGAYVLCAWLAAIVVNLALAGSFWDLALRDAGAALAAFALGRLTEWREGERGSRGAAGLRPS